ncbi:hypothetical protein BDV29DRAFT_68525 [Aspergillus leporis]|jgi:hypothetical protein|uniref:Uncharacterized protein n=1 Tax=Aspergillus leporis TaxID=41062 RepID=A0A5N5X901_9EURO|nr:hypothetical protein BDV29DRAFT_68525 [Aspergillus leporis]
MWRWDSGKGGNPFTLVSDTRYSYCDKTKYIDGNGGAPYSFPLLDGRGGGIAAWNIVAIVFDFCTNSVFWWNLLSSQRGQPERSYLILR